MINAANNAIRLKREILLQTLQIILRQEPLERLEEIPFRIIPNKSASYRCCIHKDRAIIRSRILSILGYSLDDLSTLPLFLSTAAENAFERSQPDKEIMTVIDDACSACAKSGHYVSEACRGCLARPCQGVCPVNAIEFVEGKSNIDLNKCINCGKCAKVCPYHAIIRQVAPCVESCSAKAITRNGEETAYIDNQACIQCGACVKACPFAAVVEKSQIIDVVFKIQEGQSVTLLLAPSFRGQFPGTEGQLFQALEEAGFSQIEDISAAAERCAELESSEWVEHIESRSFMTTSCCPAWVNYAEKHLPEILDDISSTPSPVEIAAQAVKQNNKATTVVFAGPCSAKKSEAFRSSNVDYVISFEELAMLLVSLDIDVMNFESLDEDSIDNPIGTGFALSGGVLNAVKEKLEQVGELSKLQNPVIIDGLTPKNKALLKAAAKGKLKGQFYEVMNCQGGCVAGPGTICSAEVSARAISK